MTLVDSSGHPSLVRLARLARTGILVAAIAAGSAGVAAAAEIAGTVTDSTGGALVAARVTLQNITTGAEQRTVTDGRGAYRFPAVPIGFYRVMTAVPGFSEEARTVSLLDAEATIELNFTLRPGTLEASVTVTALRSDRDTLVVPLRTETLSQAVLEAKNPTSTGDALMEAANITPVGSGPFQVRPRLRGLDSTRVLVLVDGERLNNARTATDRAGVEVGLVDPFSLERIEVVSGSGSVLYGTDALAGTINLITRQPEMSDDLRFNAGFDGFFSSNEDGRRGTVSLGASGPRFAVRFSGTLEEFGDYRAGSPAAEDTRPLFADGTLRQADTADALGFNFGAFPDPFNAPFVRTGRTIAGSGAQGNTLNASGIVSLTRRQSLSVKYLRRRATDIGFPDFSSPTFFQRISLPFSNLDRLMTRYRAHAITPWFSSFSATVYYQRQERLLRNDFPVQFPAPTPRAFFPVNIFRLQILSDTEQRVRTPGVDLQGTFLVAKSHVVTAGATVYRDRSEDARTTVTQTNLIGNIALGPRGPQANVFPAPVPLGPPTVSNPVRVPRSSFRDIGLFVQDEWNLNPWLRLVGGLRLDFYRVGNDATPGYDIASLIQGATPAIDPSTLPDINGDEITRTAGTGDIGLVVRVNDDVSFLAHYGRSYRHPNLEELLFAGPATVGSIVPNVRVEPERGDNVDIGVKARTGIVAGSLSYFHNRYDGFISTEIVARTPGGSLSQAVNFADVRIQGVEGTIEAAVATPRVMITPFGTVAYTHGTVLEGTDRLTGRSLDGTPQDNITPLRAVVGLRATDARGRFWAEYAARMQRDVDRVAPTLLESPFLIAQDLFALEGFAIHRLAGGVKWSRPRHRAGISFALENFTNEFYREHFQFAPARGRTFTIGLHIRTF